MGARRDDGVLAARFKLVGASRDKEEDMSDLISRAELFNRLSSVKDMGKAVTVIQRMPMVEVFEFGKWYDFQKGYVLEVTTEAFRISKEVAYE